MVARKKNCFLLTVLLISLVHFEVEAQVALVPLKSSWKYLDNGSNQGTTWRSNTFSDATWKTGNAELGYGEEQHSQVRPSVDHQPSWCIVGGGVGPTDPAQLAPWEGGPFKAPYRGQRGAALLGAALGLTVCVPPAW